MIVQCLVVVQFAADCPDGADETRGQAPKPAQSKNLTRNFIRAIRAIRGKLDHYAMPQCHMQQVR